MLSLKIDAENRTAATIANIAVNLMSHNARAAKSSGLISVGHDQATMSMKAMTTRTATITAATTGRSQCPAGRFERQTSSRLGSPDPAAGLPVTMRPTGRAADDRADEDLRGARTVVSWAKNIGCGVGEAEEPGSVKPGPYAEDHRQECDLLRLLSRGSAQLKRQSLRRAATTKPSPRLSTAGPGEQGGAEKQHRTHEVVAVFLLQTEERGRTNL